MSNRYDTAINPDLSKNNMPEAQLQAYCGDSLGFLDGVVLFNPWDYHVNTCGLARSGKSTSLAIPNIINLERGKSA